MQVKVMINDSKTLELLEDAKCGDTINLEDIQKVDLSYIEKKISSETELALKKQFDNKELLLKKEFETEKIKLENQYKEQLTKLNNIITELNNTLETNKKEFSKEKELIENKVKLDYSTKLTNLENEKNSLELVINNKYVDQVNNLKNQILILNEQIKNKDSDFNNKYANLRLELDNRYKDEINSLNSQIKDNLTKYDANLRIKINEKEQIISGLKNENDKALELANLKFDKLLLENSNKLKQEFELEKNKLIEEVSLFKEEVQTLKHQKSNLSVKLIGEDLERWCSNEVLSAMQSGFLNCKWEKDNDVKKDEDEKKGTKADFIFSIYASEELKEDEILAKCCLEMKDEDPNSKTKKKNSDHYEKLDKDRKKKNCKYALLVSTLESDMFNSVPIYKVREYEDMYVIQPPYLVAFLSLLNSLSLKFKTLLIQDLKEKIELEDINKIIADFEKLKTTYLDKPLETLVKEIENIKANGQTIIETANKINQSCENITIKYIDIIKDKIDKFNIKKITREYNKCYVK